jgi:hypothetical protein
MVIAQNLQINYELRHDVTVTDHNESIPCDRINGMNYEQNLRFFTVPQIISIGLGVRKFSWDGDVIYQFDAMWNFAELPHPKSLPRLGEGL